MRKTISKRQHMYIYIYVQAFLYICFHSVELLTPARGPVLTMCKTVLIPAKHPSLRNRPQAYKSLKASLDPES